MEMTMQNKILLKTISGMVNTYFKAHPNESIKISVNVVTKYIKDNYPEIKTDVLITADDINLILSKK